MGSWNRRNQLNNSEKQDDYKDLLVFGYQSKIYQNDYQSEHIAEERHMVPCLGDAANRVDRYDCRLLLSSLDSALKRNEGTTEICPTEAMEEDMCEEERYADLHKQLQKDREKEEEDRRREERAAIGFDYGTPSSSKQSKQEDSDSEDEPFEAPEGIKFPVGLELPSNMKLHHIIEKTAAFIVANGPQMEIVIKAKQRNNAEQFGFLEFDNKLNPFYKYLQKLIREKKYIPNQSKKSKMPGPSTASSSSLSSSSKPISSSKNSSSLAAIAAAHASDSEDDSDGSDCELHPSLLGRPASPEKPGTHGPLRKPKVEEKPPEIKDFRGSIGQRNDVYSTLFNNLAGVADIGKKKEEEKAKDKEDEVPEQKVEPIVGADSDGRLDDADYREWYEMFYGRPCPWIGPRPMLPPTPDLEPILNSYAEHVAEKGAEFEKSLASRTDLQLHFMDPISPYYSFYHHRIRIHQWRLSQPPPSFDLLNSPTPLSAVSSPGPQSLLNLTLSTPPEAPLNRRQRRRLLDSSSSRLDETITEPGVFDPLNSPLLPKSASTPGGLLNLQETPSRTPTSSKPVSFSLKSVEEESSSSSFRFDPDAEDYESVPSTSILPPPPVPPQLPTSSQMTDRKEKARIFMEKLLHEKKMKKQLEDEERMKLEEETRRKAEKISESLEERKSGRWEKPPIESGPKKTLDEIINSRINSLLTESGFNPEDVKKNEEVEKKSEVKEEKERKKHRKRSRSRRRSRSRDRNRSPDDRKKSRKSDRRHRSRSTSRDRRHRRNRSRSRDRGHRR